MTYKFLKRFKRSQEPKGLIRIPLVHWERELAKYCQDDPPSILPEDDYCALTWPPSVEQIYEIVYRLKNGTTPGCDGKHWRAAKGAP